MLEVRRREVVSSTSLDAVYPAYVLQLMYGSRAVQQETDEVYR